MINFIPVLSTVLPIIASGLLIVVIFVNIYFKLRRKFPISVNCWFCNSWTKVHYDDRNSFDCPTCLQYNGFTKDGGYNKIIPEQHDELMNKSTQIKNSKTAASNGLCTLCNNNQQLKIFQLANFVPLVEENYDVEIEHFQEQLEKAYKLCKKCDKVLKKTIDKQNAWIFGNRVKNMCSNGISAIHKISNQIIKGTKLPLLSKVNGIISAALVTSLLFIVLSNIKFVTKNVSKHVPSAYLPMFKSIVALANPPKPIRINHLTDYFPYDVKIEPFIFVCCAGLFFQMIGVIWEKYSTTVKLNRLLCWIILLLTSWIRFHKSYATYILLVEAFCCVYLLCTSFNKEEERSRQRPTKVMRKIVKNLEHTCSMSDLSDTSDIEDISNSSKKTSTSQYSSDCLNKSTCSAQSNLHNRVPVQNHTFNTANNVLNSSMRNYSELNKSLNNLHLGGLGFRSPSQTFSVASVQRPKPVLSPPKFQNNSSWVAGGFWRNLDGVIVPVAQRTNLSRSSSESSGFGSQNNENMGFVPPKSNFLGEFDKFSEFSNHVRAVSSPNYLFSPISKPVHSAFYPNLHQNNVLMVQGGYGWSPGVVSSEPVNKHTESYQRKNLFHNNWSDKINSQATQNFRDLSLHSNYH